MCIQEVKWTVQSAREIGDGYTIIHSGGSNKRNGVGVTLDPKMEEAVVDVIRHNDRLMMVKLVLQRELFNVISEYAPQTGCTQEEKDSFIVDVEALSRTVKVDEHIVIGADMNGQVVCCAGEYDGIHVGHGYENGNDEGRDILEMAQGLDLVLVNTCFKKS